MSTSSGRHFLQIPGPTNVPDRVLRAMAQPTIDHRSAEFAALGREVLDGLKARLQDVGPGRRSSRRRAPARGKRRSSTRCRRATRCWRSRSASSRGSGPRWRGGSASTSRSSTRDWTRGVDPATRRGGARRGSRAPHQGRARRAQRDVDRRRRAALAEIRRAIDRAKHPALLLRRRGVVARLDRSAPRRVGHRRHARRIAEGPDAAAGPELQRDQREGARGVADRAAAASRTGPGSRCSPPTRSGFFPTRRRRTCCSACARRCACCAKKG